MVKILTERFLHSLFLIFVWTALDFCLGDTPKLVVTNDGPAILDSTITFNATLLYPDRADYTVYWNEGSPFGRAKVENLNSTNNYSSTWSLLYSSNQSSHDRAYPGEYTVIANVGYFLPVVQWFCNVDTKRSKYNLTDSFRGSLDIWQNGKLITPQEKSGQLLVAAEDEVTFIANVHDPSNYLKTADSLTYSWFHTTSFIANTKAGVLQQNFTKVGRHRYHVTVTAVFKSSVNDDDRTEDDAEILVKMGFFKTRFTVVSDQS